MTNQRTKLQAIKHDILIIIIIIIRNNEEKLQACSLPEDVMVSSSASRGNKRGDSAWIGYFSPQTYRSYRIQTQHESIASSTQKYTFPTDLSLLFRRSSHLQQCRLQAG